MYWRITFVIDAFLYMMSGIDRLDDLSDRRFASDDVNELVERLTAFIVGGMQTPNTAYPTFDV